MNLPITMDDSIPQQAGPGAGAVQQTLEALELALHALVTDTAVPAARIAVTDAITALRAPLAVEDSREQLQRQAKDAARYVWLRQRDWFDSQLCVLRDPKKALTSGAGLGADCPSRERLDDAIDAAMKEQK